MSIPTEVWVVIIPTAGVCLTAFLTFLGTRKDRTFRADVDAYDSVLKLMTLAEGHRESGEEVSVAEQIGAMHLLGTLASEQVRVRRAVTHFFDRQRVVNGAPEGFTSLTAAEIFDRLEGL